MIGVSFEFAPSSLAHYEQVSPFVQMLLENSRTCRRRCEWGQAAHYALKAQELCGESGNHVGLALARLCLADFYSEVGEIGWAMEQCEGVYGIFRRQPSHVQRSNEAVAAYALGLLHELQLFGDDRQALHWYQEALQLLEVAQGYWAALNAKSQYKTCQQAHQWIRDRINRIVESRSNAHSWKSVFDVWSPDSADPPFARDSDLRGYILDDDRVKIHETIYRPYPEISTDKANYHFALRVPEDGWAGEGSQTNDYVLIRQQWQVNKESVGVVWEPGSGWVVGGFKRGVEGQIAFAPRSPTVIGDDPSGMVKGYITALLKPEP